MLLTLSRMQNFILSTAISGFDLERRKGKGAGR